MIYDNLKNNLGKYSKSYFKVKVYVVANFLVPFQMFETSSFVLQFFFVFLVFV